MLKISDWITQNCRFAISDNSWMIAGYPDAESVKKIKDFIKTLDMKDVKWHDSDDWHVTLRYWKGEQDKKALGSFLSERDELRNSLGVECETTGLSIFGKENSLVIRLKSQKLNAVQAKIDKAIQSEFDVPPSDFPTYEAHLTICEGIEKEPDTKPEFTIVLNRFKLVHGKNQQVLADIK